MKKLRTILETGNPFGLSAAHISKVQINFPFISTSLATTI